MYFNLVVPKLIISLPGQYIDEGKEFKGWHCFDKAAVYLQEKGITAKKIARKLRKNLPSFEQYSSHIFYGNVFGDKLSLSSEKPENCSFAVVYENQIVSGYNYGSKFSIDWFEAPHPDSWKREEEGYIGNTIYSGCVLEEKYLVQDTSKGVIILRRFGEKRWHQYSKGNYPCGDYTRLSEVFS